MSAQHSRAVIVTAGTEGGWSLVVFPRGIVHNAPRLNAALKKAERLASEFEARIEIALKPVAGDLGPRHLLNNPTVFRAEEGDGCWSVAILNRPWAVAECSCEFVGPDAEATSSRYAARVVDLIAKLSRDEQARRDRRKELSRAPRHAAKVQGDVR